MKALVVGAGRMGTFHRKVLGDLGLDVTTVDPDPSRGADFVSIPAAHFAVVCVAVPIANLAEEAARWAGHEGWLLIEKPAAPTYVDALELASLLDGQRVAIGYVERFNPRVLDAKAVIDFNREGDHHHPISATFTRWNDRPSEDVLLDLKSHDIDLSRFLGLACPVTFDTRAGVGVKCREIEIRGRSYGPIRYDLMSHDTSPLHAQWHAFLSGHDGCATLDDASTVLATIECRDMDLAA